MKPVAIFVLVAALPLVPAVAKTKTISGTDNQRVTSTTAGPDAAANAGPKDNASTTDKPSKRELKKSKVAPKPPLSDPN